jgi:hypothetical protein
MAVASNKERQREVREVLPFILGMLLRMQRTAVNGMGPEEVSVSYYVRALDLILRGSWKQFG